MSNIPTEVAAEPHLIYRFMHPDERQVGRLVVAGWDVREIGEKTGYSTRQLSRMLSPGHRVYEYAVKLARYLESMERAAAALVEDPKSTPSVRLNALVILEELATLPLQPDGDLTSLARPDQRADAARRARDPKTEARIDRRDKQRLLKACQAELARRQQQRQEDAPDPE